MVIRVDKDERGRDFLRWCQDKNYLPIDTE